MAAQLDLAFNEDQQAVAAAVARFCEAHDIATDARAQDIPLSMDLWQALAKLGVFAPATRQNSEAGGALEICAICEALGHAAFPGPVAATYLAAQVLEDALANRVIEGDSLVSLSTLGSDLLPHGMQADIFLVASQDSICLAQQHSAISKVTTLGGEQWGRAVLQPGQALDGVMRARILGDTARAAQLGGLAWRLINETSEYAAMRKQFGKSLGEFQAVSHPLADCAIAATSATTLARAAGAAFDATAGARDNELEHSQRLASGALLSARRAALEAAYVCHQVYGGIGITLEGPAFYLSRRIRQVASEPPCDTRAQDVLLANAGLGV